MALSVQFRWKMPNIVAKKNAMQQNGWSQGLSDVADSIKSAKESRYQKEQQARRNRIEDEDRKRRIDWEDKQRATYGEIADTIRGAGAERDALVRKQQELSARIAELKARLGV